MTDALELCITNYESNPGIYTGVVFGANTNPTGVVEVPVDQFDIQMSPRFAYVPQFFQSDPPNGSSSNLNIRSFRAISFGTSTRTATTVVASTLRPGHGTPRRSVGSNDKATAMTAFVFPDGMLPAQLRGNPSSVGQNNYVQLSK